jgi:hypothetical protein
VTGRHGHKVAVYDRFWRSQGGGERHVGMVAQVLSEDGCSVDLIGHEPTDLDELGEHLGLDLSRCRYVQLPDRGDAWLAERTAAYDLTVNGTYGSRLAPRSAKAAYLCFFPTPADHDLEPWRRLAIRTLGPWVRGTTPNLDYGAGWFPPEGGRRRRWTWTSSEAVLTLPAGRRVLTMDLGRPGAPGPAPRAARSSSAPTPSSPGPRTPASWASPSRGPSSPARPVPASGWPACGRGCTGIRAICAGSRPTTP